MMALPVGIVLAWAVLYRLQSLMLVLAAITPFSMNLENLQGFGGIGFYFPTEPILAVVMVLFLLWSWSISDMKTRIYAHPVSVVVIASLAWIGFTAILSSMPVVSFKFLLSRLWFVLPLFFLMVYFFRDRALMVRYLNTYTAALCAVIVITFIRHSATGFDEDVGHYIMNPFYKDHTSYGAVIALMIPWSIHRAFRRECSKNERTIMLLMLGILLIGLVFSYTRAAWVSLLGAFGVYIIMRLRIPFSLVFATLVILVAGYIRFQDDITRELERNRQDSSSSFAEHIQSITNISSDASNLERINRWNCAIRMFKERPAVGWGPGTYMFQYAPFQKSSELTIISTNQGTGGNAHSEYLGPLSEQGVPGMLLMVLLVIIVTYRAIMLYQRLDDKELKAMVMSMILGLITYFLHGVLNNFLDTDKVSVPFWGLIAGIVAIDIYHRKRTLSSAKSS